MGFYDDTPDLFDTQVKQQQGFYGGPAADTPKRSQPKPKLSFKWWEWAIIVVEVGLVTYTVLVLARVVPLF